MCSLPARIWRCLFFWNSTISERPMRMRGAGTKAFMLDGLLEGLNFLALGSLPHLRYTGNLSFRGRYKWLQNYFFSTQNHTACLYSNLNVDANSVLHQPPLLVHFPALLRCQQRAGSALCCPAAALSPSWALHGCSLLTLAPHRLFREGSSCIAVGSSALRTECKCNRDFLLRVFFFF